MADQDPGFYIYVADEPLPNNYSAQLHSLTVESSLNLPSIAEFTLLDDSLNFIDDEKLLVPGKTLQIYGKKNRGAKIFDGEIVELEPNFESPHKYCVVRGFDRLHWLMRGRFTRVFSGDSDSGIATKIISELTGLNAVVQNTNPTHDYALQDNETKLAFLQRRAAALGYVIYADGKDIHFKPPGARNEMEMEWGADGLSSFRPRLTTLGQPTEVTVRAFDPMTGKAVIGNLTGKAAAGKGQPEVGETKDRVAMTQGGAAPSTIPEVLPSAIRDSPDAMQKQVDNVALGEANRRSSEYIQAEGICGGNPQVMAGTKIKISKIGKRFGGSYLVSSATHVFNSQKQYSTHFSVTGMHAQTLQHLLGHDPAPRYGLTVGIVDQIKDDEGKICRVKVQYPLADKVKSNWARVVSAGAGSNRGIEFLPEVGDEVLIGFEHGDPHLPYVLGGLWSDKNVPPERNTSLVGDDGRVKRRLIRSKSGHTITLDDSDSSLGITVDDGKGGKIHIDTKNKTMTLEASEGIEIKSKKITINGSDSVFIDGAKIDIGK